MIPYKKINHKGIGPGGMNCPCCGPAPRFRKKWKREKKKSVRNAMKKDQQNGYSFD